MVIAIIVISIIICRAVAAKTTSLNRIRQSDVGSAAVERQDVELCNKLLQKKGFSAQNIVR